MTRVGTMISHASGQIHYRGRSSQGHIDIDNKFQGVNGAKDALESARTSVGDEESVGASNCQEDLSCVGTPVHDACESLLWLENAHASSAGNHIEEQVLEESLSPKHLEIPDEWRGKTSVMVRNISYKCTRTLFCDELDKRGFQNLFDYVYIPINAGRGTSKGHALRTLLSHAMAPLTETLMPPDGVSQLLAPRLAAFATSVGRRFLMLPLLVGWAPPLTPIMWESCLR
eukprot:TRINITY_DN1887_c1_g1_i1.p1 TRINITY_DN1887_c1_g1~~TRINITY_DN1887_c1_g1_i1.p1  ORF type:complete len:229 (-),score=21.29 TRINITY_DN1887_c1_g1_i1:711-1397(-)